MQKRWKKWTFSVIFIKVRHICPPKAVCYLGSNQIKAKNYSQKYVATENSVFLIGIESDKT
jgi:hypothetical protein